jgi:hypothetical protein
MVPRTSGKLPVQIFLICGEKVSRVAHSQARHDAITIFITVAPFSVNDYAENWDYELDAVFYLTAIRQEA